MRSSQQPLASVTIVAGGFHIGEHSAPVVRTKLLSSTERLAVSLRPWRADVPLSVDTAPKASRFPWKVLPVTSTFLDVCMKSPAPSLSGAAVPHPLSRNKLLRIAASKEAS